jgi:hypothetical protein
LETETTTAPQSPYAPQIPDGAIDARVPGEGKPKIKGEGVPEPEAIKDFIDKITGVTDKLEAAVANGQAKLVQTQTEDGVVTDAPERVMAKVLAFLDNNMRGPITLLGPIRHKYFVMKIPSQQELLEVSAFAGTTVGEMQSIIDGTDNMKISDQAWSIIGELQKACFGFLPERSPLVDTLKQNIQNPTKWPKLRDNNWLATKDPYVLQGEVYPLWAEYQKWRADVVPTPSEIDFYWANQE